MKIPLKNKTLILLVILFMGINAFSQNKYKNTEAATVTKLLGKDSIYSNKTLMENLAGINSFTKFMEGIKLTGLGTDLQRVQMYTVFVPDNSAFSAFSKKQLDSLFSSEKSAVLKQMLMNHVVPGRVDKNAIEKAIEINRGSATFLTLGGQNLNFRKEGEDIVFTGSKGKKGKVLKTNFRHSHGFFHTVNEVLPPKS
jgi:uncharacterized surface protein with fasciclin (FAS1) repeats